jgi:multidrug efflux pump subunit AcrA (membrane-fusion protein)
MRRSLFIAAAVFLTIAVIAIVGQRWFVKRSREPAAATLAQSSSQEGAATVQVDGSVVPDRWVRLSFPVGGELKIITTTAGATVSLQEPLAALITSDLATAYQLAEADLLGAKAALDLLREGARPAEIQAAQAAYDAAVAAHEKLVAGLSNQEVAILKADLRLAERAVQQAQAAYDRARHLPDIGARPEAAQLEEATIAYQRAQASYVMQTAGPDQAALKEAESLVSSRESQLEAVRAGASPAELRAAEATVDRCEAAVAQARVALERAVLRSPMSGTVTSVMDMSSGGRVAAGDTVVTVADLSQMQVEIAELDDWGAATVTLNQLANLLVPALNNRRMRGTLTFIASEPTADTSGTAFYKAIVTLDKQDPDLRWGMGVRVELDIPGGGRGR